MSESEQSSVRDDLLASIQELESKGADDANDETPAPEPEAREPEPQAQSEGEAGSEAGDDEKAVESAPSPEESPPEAGVSEKPPVNADPAVREQWNDLPQETRDWILKRESEMGNIGRENAENAKRAVAMDQVLAPFANYFAMDGGNPQQTITGLLQTASILHGGNDDQRAMAAARILTQFNVPIDKLDQILAGDPVAQQPQPQQMTPELVTQISNQTWQQNQAQQNAARIAQEIQAFAADPAHEFYNDVQDGMVAFIETRERMGNPVPSGPAGLKEAYDYACQMNPQVNAVLQSRASQPTPQQIQAASSISGSPTGPGVAPPAEPNSVREALEQSIREQQQKGVARI